MPEMSQPAPGAGLPLPLPGPVEALVDVLVQLKPRLRGALHAVGFPLIVTGGILALVEADTARAQVAAALFTACSALLLGTSAVYHLGRWSPRTHTVLARLDHANIYLAMAGTFTPFALLCLPSAFTVGALVAAWSGALLGAATRVFLPGTPRYLATGLYALLGWAALLALPAIHHAAGAGVVALLVAGGVLYTLGALVYAVRWPDPAPRWFGFHEIFHAHTLAAMGCQYVAVLAVCAAN